MDMIKKINQFHYIVIWNQLLAFNIFFIFRLDISIKVFMVKFLSNLESQQINKLEGRML